MISNYDLALLSTYIYLSPKKPNYTHSGTRIRHESYCRKMIQFLKSIDKKYVSTDNFYVIFCVLRLLSSF